MATMSKKKVLIVEDNADVRAGLHLLLKAHQYETVLAADGLMAITEAVRQSPDLVILDLGLPAGDGFSVLERLRALPHLEVVPVIVVSAREALKNKERALKAGARAYLEKPWNDAD